MSEHSVGAAGATQVSLVSCNGASPDPAHVTMLRRSEAIWVKTVDIKQ